MPGGGRSFRRRTAELWEVWPMPVPDGELHRAPRRRDLGRARPRRAHMLQRREGGLLVHGEVGELEGVVGPHVADPGARGGRHRRRERVRQGRARDLAAHQGPEVHLPRLLAGQALHDDAAEAPGGARVTSSRATSWASRRCTRPSSGSSATSTGAGSGADFLEDRTVVDGRRVYTHERLRRARSSLSSLVSAGTLFTYLDPCPGQGRPAAVDQQHDRGRVNSGLEGRPGATTGG